MSTTKIEWSEKVWNPVTGCIKVSAGCKFCYAETYSTRFWKGRPFSDVQSHKERLDKPRHWRKPRMIFVNSMSDLFQERVETSFIDQVMEVIRECPHHTFQVLTKRSKRARNYMTRYSKKHGVPENVWLGISAEDTSRAKVRLNNLLRTPAKVRFASFEPLLGSIPLRRILNGFFGDRFSTLYRKRSSSLLHWAILGGESGPHARPCRLEWMDSLSSDLQRLGVTTFVKQLGACPALETRRPMESSFPSNTKYGWVDSMRNPNLYRAILADKKGADPAEWPSHLRKRNYPVVR